jgi:aspartate kinase
MARLVMKFGGTSVADIDRIRNVARHVKREVDAGHDVAVVVSAMSGTTNQLVGWCEAALKSRQIFDAREYDAVVATGEQITSGLLAITLQDMDINARSWQGWQLPILTSDAHASARILDINGEEIVKRFRERKEVAVISGFQGLHKETGRITTLGRGGSDTSAVAVAAAIKADRCDIYTDVDGIYTTDPRVVPRARRLEKIAFEEMLELASLGAKVMQVRSVELGMVHRVRIFVRSSFDRPEDIDPHSTPPGTLICDEDEIMEQQTVTGIAFSRDEAQISVRQVEDKPGVAAAIFIPLADANINVDMIVQNVSEDGKTTDLTFTVPAADYQRALDVVTKAKPTIGYQRLDSATDVAKISVIGIGMRSHAGVAAQAFGALAERAVNIRAITTSEIKFSLLIDAAFTELAVRTLHSLYDLDRPAACFAGRKLPSVGLGDRRDAARWFSIFSSSKRHLTLAATHKIRLRHRSVFGLRFAYRIRYRLQSDRRGPVPGVFLFGFGRRDAGDAPVQASPRDLTPCVARSAVRACCCGASAKSWRSRSARRNASTRLWC